MKSGVLYYTEISLVAGVYRLKDECGFPIDMSYEILKENGYYIDWMEALVYAASHGIEKMDGLLSEIKYLIPNEYNEIYNRWSTYFMVHYNKIDDKNDPDIFNKVAQSILKEKRNSHEAIKQKLISK